MFDVVIVGGGPAGLSAALVLGRCRRAVLVCDSGHPRNARARMLNGYLTRDGLAPTEFLHIARDELRRYGIEVMHATVVDVQPRRGGFLVMLDDGREVESSAVLLATGVRDQLPAIPGLVDCYGISVHHCPYCDGWEVRDRTIAALGDGVSPAGLALSLKTWTDRVVACAHGGRVAGAHRRQLRTHGIELYMPRVARLDHADGRVRALVFEDGGRVACEAVFFASGQSQQSGLARRLGCEFTNRGTVKADRLGRTCVPGIYVVGDASRDVQFVVVAASEGAKAGVAINKALQAREGLVAAQAPASAASS